MQKGKVKRPGIKKAETLVLGYLRGKRKAWISEISDDLEIELEPLLIVLDRLYRKGKIEPAGKKWSKYFRSEAQR